MLIGDYNIDLLKFQQHDKTSEFLNTIFSHTFYPLITKPTRISDHSATLIDNIFCNDISKENICGLLNTDISDHMPFFSFLQSCSNEKHQIPIEKYERIINDQGLRYFREKIDNLDWTPVLLEQNPDTAYNLFRASIKTDYNEAFPIRLIKIKNN